MDGQWKGENFVCVYIYVYMRRVIDPRPEPLQAYHLGMN